MKNRPITSAFTRMFDLRYPIVGAPMFLVSYEKLVVAVSNAGGLGTFPALNYRPIEKYRDAIRNIKKMTDKPFGINIIVQKSNKYREDQINIALEEEVPLIITSLGSPERVINRAKGSKTKVFCDVIGKTHAKKVASLGADGLIAVSYGAGGHAGNISPFVLIPQLIKETGLPVLAAGNIVDGKGMAAAFSLGASAVYVGTRFIASKESEVTENYKNDIINFSSEDIINTDKVDGFPGNFINNETLQKMGTEKGFFELLFSKSKKMKRLIALSRAGKALLMSKEGKYSYKNVYSAGQGIGLIDNIESVESIFEKMVGDYLAIIKKLPGQLPD